MCLVVCRLELSTQTIPERKKTTERKPQRIKTDQKLLTGGCREHGEMKMQDAVLCRNPILNFLLIEFEKVPLR